MKSSPILATLIITACFTALGQTKESSKKQSGDVEQTLMNIEQEMDDAVVKGDTSANEKYLADNSTFTDPGGMVMDKARSIDDLKSGNLKIQSSKLDDMKVLYMGMLP